MKLVYPRKCHHCDYVSNNPAMWHFHAKTHIDIPPGTLCWNGCNQLAKIVRTNGKFACSVKPGQCPAYTHEQSRRVKAQWSTNNWEHRKQVLRDRSLAETSHQRSLRSIKQVATKQAKLMAVEHSLSQRQYAQSIIRRSHTTYKRNKELLNPNNLVIARDQYHLDHRVSRHVGWLLQIPIQYMCSVHNLCLMHNKLNSGKGSKCSLHPLELYKYCGASSEEIAKLIQTLELQPALMHLIEQGKL